MRNIKILVSDEEFNKIVEETAAEMGISLVDEDRSLVSEDGWHRTKTIKAVDIKWDTDDELDDELVGLPTEIAIPHGMINEDEISDYLSDVTGYCHKGFRLVQE